MQFGQRLLVLGVAVVVLGAGGPRADTAPLHTISRYVSNPDPARWFDLGCALGTAVFEGTRRAMRE